VSKTLEQLRRNKKVMFVDDEREIGNEIIITLDYGWRLPDEYASEHVRGFDTVKEARDAVGRAQTCRCEECLSKVRKIEEGL